jgi:hypothetical protein
MDRRAFIGRLALGTLAVPHDARGDEHLEYRRVIQ